MLWFRRLVTTLSAPFSGPQRRGVRGLIGLLGAGLLCFFALRRVDLGALLSALRSASLWPLALAMVIDFVLRTLVRTRRTFVVLRATSPARIGFGPLLLLVLAGGAAGCVLPGPSEEAVQTAMLRRFDFRLADLLAAQVIEKSLSVLSIVVLVLAFLPPLGVPKVPLGVGVMVLAAVALYRVGTRRGVGAGRLLEAFALVVASNLLCVVMMWLAFLSLGAHPGWITCLAIFSVTACAGAVPLSPGQLGVIESAFVLAATHLGLASETALAVSILYHATHVIPSLVGGMVVALHGRPFIAAPTTQSAGVP